MGNKKEIYEYWENYFSRSPFRQKMGFQIQSMDENEALLIIKIDPEFHTQTAGIVHGGVIASLIDGSIATAARWHIRKDQRTVTTDMNIHYLRAAKGNELEAQAKISHSGKTLLFGTCNVFSENKKVAFGSASYRVLAIK